MIIEGARHASLATKMAVHHLTQRIYRTQNKDKKMNNTYHHKLKVTFKLYQEGEEKIYCVTGRVAQTIMHLVEAGKHGITALEMSSWAFRLGAYIHRLRREYNVDIETKREPHIGGSHARYILHSPVEIQEVE